MQEVSRKSHNNQKGDSADSLSRIFPLTYK